MKKYASIKVSSLFVNRFINICNLEEENYTWDFSKYPYIRLTYSVIFSIVLDKYKIKLSNKDFTYKYLKKIIDGN